MRTKLPIYSGWVRQQLMWMLLSMLSLMLIYPKTGLDQRLIAPCFHVVNQQFSLKNTWLLKTVLYTGLKYDLIFVALSALLVGVIGSLYIPLKYYQQRLFWVFALMLFSTSVAIHHNNE